VEGYCSQDACWEEVLSSSQHIHVYVVELRDVLTYRMHCTPTSRLHHNHNQPLPSSCYTSAVADAIILTTNIVFFIHLPNMCYFIYTITSSAFIRQIVSKPHLNASFHCPPWGNKFGFYAYSTVLSH